MLGVRAMVFCGYMPYGWLGPVPISNGFSPFDVVANDAVELTDVRCDRGEGEGGGILGPRLCMEGGRPSCGGATFAVLFRVATLRRSLLLGFDVDACRCIASSRSWSCLSLFNPSLALAGRKPSETDGMKSFSSGSIS